MSIVRKPAGSLLLVVGMLAGLASQAAGAKPVVVASTNFSEQLVLANIYANVLEKHGVKVKKRLHLGSREVVFPALKSGEVDVLPEYSGALLAYLADDKVKETGKQAVLDQLRAQLPAKLVALKAASAQNKDALVVTAKTAEQYQLNTIADLKPVAGQLTFGGPPEIKTRRDGMPGLKSVYGIQFKNFRSLDAGGPLTQSALSSGAIQVARMFTTQGVIQDKGWRVLKDTKHLVPAQNLIPIIRKSVVTPKIRKLLKAVSSALTTKQLRAMNKRVAVDKRDPAQVAQKWVAKHDL
ncbi:ABC transporter substrate-binding protein [Salinisphaera orenii]|uniref:ABC transporter substrate-binding protein n=1 Tax=Salinisphaera orenii TaxID=856731 RepID=UPI000DBE4BFC